MMNFPSKLRLRIDWSELDYFGHVNNVQFFKYIQSSRVNYWELIGLKQFHLDKKIGPLLASCECQFRKPLFFPGEIVVESRLDFIKNTSFGLHHRILNENGEIAAEAKDVMVMYDFNKDEKTPFPEELRKNIESVR